MLTHLLSQREVRTYTVSAALSDPGNLHYYRIAFESISLNQRCQLKREAFVPPLCQQEKGPAREREGAADPSQRYGMMFQVKRFVCLFFKSYC